MRFLTTAAIFAFAAATVAAQAPSAEDMAAKLAELNVEPQTESLIPDR